MIYPTILYNGKMYSIFSYVYSAQGSTSGHVGTWATTNHQSSNTPSWEKRVRKLNADLSYSLEFYTSNTGTFGATPNSNTVGTYTQGISTLIMTQTNYSHAPWTEYYITSGSYLVIGSDASLGAFTKK